MSENIGKNIIKLHPFPKSSCSDCVPSWWICMWQLRHISQPQNTERRGTRGNRGLNISDQIHPATLETQESHEARFPLPATASFGCFVSSFLY